MLPNQELQTPVTLFRNSLRSWQAQYKASQPSGPAGLSALFPDASTPRLTAQHPSRLIARARRKRLGENA